MDPERRVLLAIFLAFLVLYVWQALFVKPAPKPGAAGTATTTSVPATAGGRSSAGMPAAPGKPAAAAITLPSATAATPSPPGAAALVGETTERDVRVETSDVIAVFTNRGARLKSWRLKRYLDRDKHPQELVDTEVQSQPLPFSLRTPDDRVTTTVNDAVYAVSGAPSGVSASPFDLRFEYSDNAGVQVVKQFHFDPGSFIVTFRATVNDGTRAVTPEIVWGPAVGDVVEVSRYTKKAEGLLFTNGKVQRLQTKDIAKQSAYDGDFKYAGVDDNYFMTAALFVGPAKISFQPVAIPPPADSKDPPRDLMAFAIEPRAADTPVKFFIGPKDFDVLTSIDAGAHEENVVVQAIDFGMFTILVRPLLWSLKRVNTYVGNYGWSIIILTILINGVMFPLRHKSVVSMRKMQEIQPEVKAIQDRYAKFKTTDPAKQKMNQELMALYKDRGVNPASGCVPMLLTMPVLFAMWSMLSTAIELRGAPFVGWIHDLTSHDPLYITPVIMGASQLWQQRLTPNTGADPAQQKMMMFMPIIFTAMFLWLPAGVAIYYAVSNLWGIGQQYLTNYMIGPPKIRHVRPPGERQLKKKE